ncbi:DUF2172 domain-containing protein [Gammaproteobacteria bacterium]|nr:DUF2172 domain-containing protein [Gammaproteobacteria bacterium]
MKMTIIELANKLHGLKRYHNSADMHCAVELLIDFFGGFADVYDSNMGTTWDLPKFYHVNYARLLNSHGEVIANYTDHVLSLWSNSPSYSGQVNYSELKDHILTDQSRPQSTLFHFRNQYRFHEREWGFSLPFEKFKNLDASDTYTVEIDTSFEDLPMHQYISSYPHAENNFVLVAHLDHPNQLNDGLSSCLVNNQVVSNLANTLININLVSINSVEIVGTVFFTKKFDINSQNTLGAISTNGLALKESFKFQYSSTNGASTLDKLISLYSIIYGDGTVEGYREGWGNDEIAFEVPGVEVSCASIHRFPHATYHSDRDDMEGWNQGSFDESVEVLGRVIQSLDVNYLYRVKAINHLICFSSPSVNLYLEPGEISGLKNDDMKNVDRFITGLTRRELTYIQDNLYLLNQFMNMILPMFSRQPALSVLEISFKAKLPPVFVNNYLSEMENLNLVSLEKYAK